MILPAIKNDKIHHSKLEKNTYIYILVSQYNENNPSRAISQVGYQFEIELATREHIFIKMNNMDMCLTFLSHPFPHIM